MNLELRLFVELPFSLNLPDDTYSVMVDGVSTEIHIRQGIFVGHSTTSNDMAIGSRDEVAARLAGFTYYPEPLRTVAQHSQTLHVEAADVINPSDEQMLTDLAQEIILRAMTPEPDPMGKAAAQLQLLGEAERAERKARLAKKLTAKEKLTADVDRFQTAVNTLVRLYMGTFRDPFVEEISFHQLGGTVAKGVMLMWFADGILVYNVARVGKVPPVLTGQWQDHGGAAYADFKAALAAGTSPSSVELLCVRGFGFLERGAFRSAIIEASAALETAVTKKIWEKFRAAGKTDTEIIVALKATQTRFDERAKDTFKEATGRTVVEVADAADKSLWQNVLAHREHYRHKIAHADLEPTRADAESAVEAFTTLARLVVAV